MFLPVHLLSEMIKTTVRSAKAVVIAYLGSSREYLMYNREKNILGVVWFGPFPLPSPFPFNKMSIFLSFPVFRPSRLLTGGGGEGRGKEPNHATARKPGPLQSINYFTLWAPAAAMELEPLHCRLSYYYVLYSLQFTVSPLLFFSPLAPVIILSTLHKSNIIVTA
jgi:hypothetical protein